MYWGTHPSVLLASNPDEFNWVRTSRNFISLMIWSCYAKRTMKLWKNSSRMSKSVIMRNQRNSSLSLFNNWRWHPLIIRWCFQLYASSSKGYQFLLDSEVLLLPDKRTLRDYSNYFKVDSGFDFEFINRSNPKDCDVWVGSFMMRFLWEKTLCLTILENEFGFC